MAEGRGKKWDEGVWRRRRRMVAGDRAEGKLEKD